MRPICVGMVMSSHLCGYGYAMCTRGFKIGSPKLNRISLSIAGLMCGPRGASSRRLVGAETAEGSRPRQGAGWESVEWMDKAELGGLGFWTFGSGRVYGVCKKCVRLHVVFVDVVPNTCHCVIVSLCHLFPGVNKSVNDLMTQ